MIRLRSPVRLAVLCLAVTLLSSLAQEEQGVTVQFVSFPRVADPEPVELLTSDGETIKVEIPSNELSKPYRLTAPANWVVGKTVTGEDGKTKFESWGKAKALTSSRQLVLLIRRGKANAAGFAILPFDSRASQFGSEKFLFLNAAKFDIAGEVGKMKFLLKPGKHTIVKPRPDIGKDLCHAALYYRKEQRNWKSFFSSNWPLQKNARGLVFIYNDPKTSRLRLHSIHDFMDTPG